MCDCRESYCFRRRVLLVGRVVSFTSRLPHSRQLPVALIGGYCICRRKQNPIECHHYSVCEDQSEIRPGCGFYTACVRWPFVSWSSGSFY